MTRKVFFSFHFQHDAWRVGQVRNSNVVRGYEKNTFFHDKAAWEKIKLLTPGGIRGWIDKQLQGTSVTVVLIGAETASRPWVQYEIKKSIERGNALLGVHIAGIKDANGQTDNLGKNPLPSKYPIYKWNHNNGAANLARWIEDAVAQQRRF